MFPRIPSQSRFNRRRRNLMDAFDLIRQAVLRVLDLAADRDCTIDSLPVPVVQVHLVPSSTADANQGSGFPDLGCVDISPKPDQGTGEL